ncbi:MAG TPA: hypothetical protein VKG63_02400 [Steroidobacteraceae bacterium]|nr:hypothetical protein [Steroidobacteraceae bacterium]
MMLVSSVAAAGTSFDMTARDLLYPSMEPSVTHHFVQNGQTRIETADGVAALFRNQSIITIDPRSRTVRINNGATRDRTLTRMVAQVDALRRKAVTLPADQRAKMEEQATYLENLRLETYKTISREYTVTRRSEVVDGHECRIWRETENGAMRLELCMVPVGELPGGDEILAGMKTLSEFPAFGSVAAVGVELGYGEWWPGIDSLVGLPILVREFEHGDAAFESTISNVRSGVPVGARFDIPQGYQRK